MGAMPAHAQSVQQGDQRVRDIVGAGKVRIGVFPSTQYSKDTKTGEQRGLALAITRALTSRLGVTEVATVEHPNPVAVVACVKAGECDLGFVSIEPARLAEVDFTPPYIRRDFTYLVPANSSVRGVDDADRPGIRIATVSVMLRRLRWYVFLNRPSRYTPMISTLLLSCYVWAARTLSPPFARWF
jgi:ABC-type amino acid transport substrate-binding protein